MASGIQNNKGLTDDEMAALEASNGLTDEQMAALEAQSSPTLRPMGLREQIQSQYVKMPTEQKKKILESKGIDPDSLDEWSVGGAIPNVSRLISMGVGGFAGGMAGGPAGAIAGAGAAGALEEAALMNAAESQSGGAYDTIGLREMVGSQTRTPNDYAKYLLKSGLESSLQEAAGQAFNPYIAKGIKSVGRRTVAAAKVLQKGFDDVMNTAPGKAVGQAMTMLTSPLRAVMDKGGHAADAVGRYLWTNVSNLSQEALQYVNSLKGRPGFEDTPWKNVLTKFDREALDIGARDIGKTPDQLTPREARIINTSPGAYVKHLSNYVKDYFFPEIKAIKGQLGREVSRSREVAGLFDDRVKFGMGRPEYVRELQGIVDRYDMNLLPEERELVDGLQKALSGDPHAMKAFNKSGGNTSKFITQLRKDQVALDRLGKLKGFEPGTYREPVEPLSYREINDTINRFDQMLTGPYRNDSDALVNYSPRVGIVKAFRQAINERVKVLKPSVTGAVDKYASYMEKLNDFEDAVGNTPQKALEFIARNVLADRTPGNTFGKDAANEILTSPQLQGQMDTIKQLIVNIYARGTDVKTSGFKASLVPEAVKLTHITPRAAMLTRKGLEDITQAPVRFGRGTVEALNNPLVKKATPWAARASVLAPVNQALFKTPAYQAMEDLRDEQGINVSNEDRINSLK